MRAQDDDRELERQAALEAFRVLDTPPESAFDDITALAAAITDAPTALVSLVSAQRQWFKSVYNFPLRETARDLSFCAHAILQTETLVVADATIDPRFRDNALVTGDPNIRFYAGAPLRTSEGVALGTLCVIDYAPRELTAKQQAALEALARQVMKELELRRSVRELAATVTGRHRMETPEVLQAIVDKSPALIYVKDVSGRYLMVNAAFEETFSVAADSVIGRRVGSIARTAGFADSLDQADADVVDRLLPVALTATLESGSQLRHFTAVSFPLLDWTGKPYAVATIATDVTERRAYEENLRFVSEHDALTGLYNRARFELEVSRQLAAMGGSSGCAAVLIVDLDTFKHINEGHGHHAGDDYLRGVADLLRGSVGPGEVMGRTGGDEFGVLLRGVDEAAAQKRADSIVAAIRAYAPPIAGRSIRATASIGGCAFTDAALTADDVMVSADAGLLLAKERGRDRATLAPPTPWSRSRSQREAGWGDRIRHALAEDRFVLFAQPILDVATGEPAYHELLLRMLDDDGSPLLPGMFLPTAERFDLVQSLDRWVISEAIDLVAAQAARGTTCKLDINLSAKSVQQESLPDFIDARLRETGIDPSCLVFEITETAAIANLARARAFAERLRGVGCSFALDDFGTGFGSFYYVKHLPLDFVKIDGEFVRELAHNRFDQIVVESVVKVSAELGYRTIAEYVGDDITLDLLHSYGVDLAQGFHLGRPVPVSQAFAS